jgi:glycerol-3-phosphate acyltransferase PlsY
VKWLPAPDWGDIYTRAQLPDPCERAMAVLLASTYAEAIMKDLNEDSRRKGRETIHSLGQGIKRMEVDFGFRIPQNIPGAPEHLIVNVRNHCAHSASALEYSDIVTFHAVRHIHTIVVKVAERLSFLPNVAVMIDQWQLISGGTDVTFAPEAAKLRFYSKYATPYADDASEAPTLPKRLSGMRNVPESDSSETAERLRTLHADLAAASERADEAQTIAESLRHQIEEQKVSHPTGLTVNHTVQVKIQYTTLVCYLAVLGPIYSFLIVFNDGTAVNAISGLLALLFFGIVELAAIAVATSLWLLHRVPPVPRTSAIVLLILLIYILGIAFGRSLSFTSLLGYFIVYLAALDTIAWVVTLALRSKNTARPFVASQPNGGAP